MYDRDPRIEARIDTLWHEIQRLKAATAEAERELNKLVQEYVRNTESTTTSASGEIGIE